MTSPLRFLILALATLAFGPAAQARLGDTEAQSKARYGASNPDLIAATDHPLLPGATEVAYSHEGWRIRAAFLNGTTAAIEYIKIPDAGGLKKVTEEEVRAILEAEKGSYNWREEKPRLGNHDLNALKTAIAGRTWERTDHAQASLKLDLVLVLQTHDAEAQAKRLEKQAGKPAAAATPALPKF